MFSGKQFQPLIEPFSPAGMTTIRSLFWTDPDSTFPAIANEPWPDRIIKKMWVIYKGLKFTASEFVKVNQNTNKWSPGKVKWPNNLMAAP